MFDHFLTTLKTQTTQWSASFNDLRMATNATHKTCENSQQQSPTKMYKSHSSYCMSSAAKQLKWPVLVGDEKQWVSSSSLDVVNRADQGDPNDESETVFRNPALKDEDSEEECLVDKFDRANVRLNHRVQVGRFSISGRRMDLTALLFV